MDDFPPYPAGLRLAGRRVVVVGGGHVAQRRVPAPAGPPVPSVTVVSPEVTPALEELAGAGEVSWVQRGFEASDLEGAWYAIAATDDADANEHVTVAAEERRIFCVRADDGTRATRVDARRRTPRRCHRRGARVPRTPALGRGS